MSENTLYGLAESDIQNVIALLRQNQKIEKIILFGSRAKGTFNSGSDVDIAIIGNSVCLNDVLDATIEIEKLNLPYKFDLIVYDRINEEALKEHIDRVGVVLYKKSKDCEGTVRRTENA
jgi:predicted nucleotidyltransferase